MTARFRHIASFLALLSILFSAHGGLVARALFELRQDFLAEHHCENRHRPEVKCNGVCFLKKHIAEHQQHEHDQKAEAPAFPVLFFVVVEGGELPAPRATAATYRHVADVPAPSALPEAVYHPPRMV